MSTPAQDQYSEIPSNPDTGGVVPFTGLDAIALAFVAVGVLVSGWVLRRAAGRA